MQDGKHVILCIDDDPDVLDCLRIVLEANGYIMVAAESAAEGLRAYQQSNPDLILVDLMMEEVDAGAQFVKDLQARGNKAPIYLLSSAGDGLTMSTDTSELGLSGVFQKPLDNDAFLTVLATKLK